MSEALRDYKEFQRWIKEERKWIEKFVKKELGIDFKFEEKENE